MNNITIKKITDVNEAKKIWDQLSPKNTIYDDWDFRYIYSNLIGSKINFIVLYFDNEAVSLLPLELTEDNLIFFGGNFTEDNKFFTKKGFEKYEIEILQFISNENYKLGYMESKYANSEFVDNVYFLPLENLKDKNSYIDAFWSGKARQNLRSQIRKLESLNLEVKYNVFSDVNKMIELNKKRFGPSSTFNRFPKRQEYLMKLSESFESYSISIYINGQLESVGFSIKFNDTYYGFNSGTNNNYNGLGKYLILEKIQQAIKSGASYYNARSGNLGWKENFGFTPKPQYRIVNN